MARTARRTKRSTFRRRRNTRYKKRMLAKPRIGKRLYQPIHYFTRSVSYTIQLNSGSTSFHGVLVFSLNALPGYSEFLNLYDMYKINAVKVSFIPVSNVTLSLGTAGVIDQYTSNYSRFQSVIDYNDDTALTSANEYREYSTYKWTPNTKIHKRYFRPRFTPTVTEGSGSYGIATSSGWVATGSNATRWYGVKYHINFGVTASSTLTTHEVEVKYYLSFKNYK